MNKPVGSVVGMLLAVATIAAVISVAIAAIWLALETDHPLRWVPAILIVGLVGYEAWTRVNKALEDDDKYSYI